MHVFAAFVKKEFLHIIRDYRTLIILLGIPVAQVLIFGFVITNEVKDARIAILDKSKDDVSKKFCDKLLSSGYFILDQYIESADKIEKKFKKGKVREVVIIDQDFGKNLMKEGTGNVQIIADASDPNTANILVQYTTGIIRDFMNEQNMNKQLPVFINPEVRMIYNKELKGVYMFVPGTIALILTLISTLMTSVTITREKEFGTMEAILVSPLKPYQIITGKVMPYISLALINAIVILIMGYFVFDLPLRGNLTLLMAETILFIFLTLSLGIFISTVSDSQQMAIFISLIGLMLPTILLSGFIFPVENMPVILQWFSSIMPPRWFIQILKDIMLKGNGFVHVWKETMILTGMIVGFMLLSIVRFKTRLE
jgi:ABC-2 type transport system permease protein